MRREGALIRGERDVLKYAMLSSMGAYFYTFIIVITVWHGIDDFLCFAKTNFCDDDRLMFLYRELILRFSESTRPSIYSHVFLLHVIIKNDNNIVTYFYNMYYHDVRTLCFKPVIHCIPFCF